jgi:hypothetical protein
MRKLTPAILIAASVVFSASVLSRLPARVLPRFDALLPWLPVSEADAMPRAVAAFMMPALAALIWLLMSVLASPAGERLGRRVFPSWLVSERTGAAAVERFGPTFDVIITSVIAFVLLLHTVLLGTVLGWPAWTLQAFSALVGVGIMVVGNIMPRTRPNWIAGLRTRRTLSDPDVWRRTHRWFGALMMVTGVAVVIASIVAAHWAFIVGLAGVLVSAAVAAVVAS